MLLQLATVVTMVYYLCFQYQWWVRMAAGGNHKKMAQMAITLKFPIGYRNLLQKERGTDNLLVLYSY